MTSPPTISRERARRIAVRAQLLDAPPADLAVRGLVETVCDLTLLQIDPVAAIAPSADLVCWSRLGEAYDPSDLRFALETEHSLVEFGSFVRATDDVGLLLATAPQEVHPQAVAWVERNARFRGDVLARLADDGPLVAGEIDDTAQEPWASSGWTNEKNVLRMLELLVRLGDVAIAGRRGKLRTFDLAERVYPSDVVVPPYAEARAELDRRRLGSLGIARPSFKGNVGEELGAGGLGTPVVVDGVEGQWRADPDALASRADEEAGRCALLSPYDRLVYDRERALALFDFEYVLEMYKPAAKRRWGYYALPILAGDRLVGKLDAKADRRKGVLTVHAVHQDGVWDAPIGDAVETQIDALAEWLGLEVVRP